MPTNDASFFSSPPSSVPPSPSYHRQLLRWRGLSRLDQLAVASATVLGVGFSPWAPGTLGTGVAVLCFYRLRFSLEHQALGEQPMFWLFLLLVLAFGSWAAKRVTELLATPDASCIVLDEWLGFGVAAASLGTAPEGWLLAFLVFRFLDIVKPPPIRQLDGWSKTQVGFKAGFGVLADDLLAGGVTLLLMCGLQRFFSFF